MTISAKIEAHKYSLANGTRPYRNDAGARSNGVPFIDQSLSDPISAVARKILLKAQARRRYQLQR
jgi:hypothetical protein